MMLRSWRRGKNGIFEANLDEKDYPSRYARISIIAPRSRYMSFGRFPRGYVTLQGSGRRVSHVRLSPGFTHRIEDPPAIDGMIESVSVADTFDCSLAGR